MPQEELPKDHTNHVLQLDPDSCPAPSVPISAGGSVVEELGVEEQDQTHAVVCVNAQHLMAADF